MIYATLAYLCISALGYISLYRQMRPRKPTTRFIYGDTWQLPATSCLCTHRPEQRYPR